MKRAIISKSLEDTTSFAESLLRDVSVHKSATVWALSGDLGSGKTAFAKEVGELLGIPKDEITSPTFVIEKIYALPMGTGTFTHFIHIDAYRLESEHELETLGWNEIVSNPRNLILIEWPEMVSGLIPKNATNIRFQFVDEETREITIQ